MSSANKQTALAAHRASRKRPFHLRFRRPVAHVFWAFQRNADFSVSPPCSNSSVSPVCSKLPEPHQASRKRPFHGHFRRPIARVFWAFPAHPEIFTFPACPSFSSSPLCPESFTFPACLEFSASSAHPERSAPRQSSRKCPFHLHSRRPVARVFWAFQRGADFSVSLPCPDFSAFPAHPAPDASGALFRRAVLRGERPGRDQPFGAHAS